MRRLYKALSNEFEVKQKNITILEETYLRTISNYYDEKEYLIEIRYNKYTTCEYKIRFADDGKECTIFQVECQ